MKTACLPLAAALAALLFVQPAAAEKKDSKKSEQGFTKLYNGKDLSGWTTTGNWLPQEDGVLAIKPRKGEKGWQRYGAYLWTEKQYGDFVLKLEFKIPPRGNSGVFVRVADRDNPVKTGLEVQILDSYGKKGKLGHHDNGGIIRTAGPEKNASKPAGEWNQLTITMKGSHIQVELNGQQIHDLNLEKTASKDTKARGYIGLQDHGLPLEFRNIRIKELK